MAAPERPLDFGRNTITTVCEKDVSSKVTGMYELLIIACLAGQPDRCEEFNVPFEAPTGMRICMQHAQFRMAEWIDTMPGWDVKKWTCGLPKT